LKENQLTRDEKSENGGKEERKRLEEEGKNIIGPGTTKSLLKTRGCEDEGGTRNLNQRKKDVYRGLSVVVLVKDRKRPVEGRSRQR